MSDNSDIVRYRRKPLTPEQVAELERLASVPDTEIDLMDMPELPDSFFQDGLRAPIPTRIDARVQEWFAERAREQGEHPTMAINRVLIEYMQSAKAKQAKKVG